MREELRRALAARYRRPPKLLRPERARFITICATYLHFYKHSWSLDLPGNPAERRETHNALAEVASACAILVRRLSRSSVDDKAAHLAAGYVRECFEKVLPVWLVHEQASEDEHMAQMFNPAVYVERFVHMTAALESAIKQQAAVMAPGQGKKATFARDLLIHHLALAWKGEFGEQPRARHSPFSILCSAAGSAVGVEISDKVVGNVLRRHAVYAPKKARTNERPAATRTRVEADLLNRTWSPK